MGSNSSLNSSSSSLPSSSPNNAIPTKEVKPLHSELNIKLEKIREKRAFNPEEFVKTRGNQLLYYLLTYNIKTVVLSVSGGVDSACILGILKYAQSLASLIPLHPFNPVNGGQIIAVAQPIHSTKSIQNRAWEAGKVFDVPIITIDQTIVHDMIINSVEKSIGTKIKPFAQSMFKSYQRTPTAYLLASHFGGVVVGTGNLDEDGYLYYYCKFGDGAVDIGLIWDLHKSEVFKLAKHLGVPESILIAPPSADLAPGQTDETESGVTYDQVELVYNYLFRMEEEEREQFLTDLCVEAREQFDREFEMIKAIHDRGSHKADLNPKNMGSDWYYKWSESVNTK